MIAPAVVASHHPEPQRARSLGLRFHIVKQFFRAHRILRVMGHFFEDTDNDEDQARVLGGFSRQSRSFLLGS